MKLTVFGATGGTGLQLVRQALDLTHEITAVVRDPARLPAELRPRVDVVRADVMDPGAIISAIEGRDAVVCALGPRGTGPTTVHSAATRSIVAAMERAGVRRVLSVGAAGMVADAGDDPFTRYVLKPLVLQRILRHSFGDLAVAERLLRQSRLDWTIVRPSRLTDSGRTNRYRTAKDVNLRFGFLTSRADLADCVLDLIEDRSSVGHVISVAS
ncbi:SDR family oxidoreductase [Nonomuraea sp. NN258]|uniref:NAD(P)-dependent oxidoreductase n=1 Tax=Nonomuraea antri TaxID=2730852 RepID=UPI001568FD99|nr:SDR family oxidoreductase [Nonomuraea antri]NRQ35480.1 SDR family oxidoreductase [Nonomuraea antri]